MTFTAQSLTTTMLTTMMLTFHPTTTPTLHPTTTLNRASLTNALPQSLSLAHLTADRPPPLPLHAPPWSIRASPYHVRLRFNREIQCHKSWD